MKDVQIDVHLEIARGEIADHIYNTKDKNVLAAAIVERVREHAERIASGVGGTVRTDRAPEWYIRRGSHVTQGGDFLLVASRWWVTVPNWFEPTTQPHSRVLHG
jgi:hypothetical protein